MSTNEDRLFQTQIAAESEFEYTDGGDLQHVLGDLKGLIESDNAIVSHHGWLESMALALVDAATESDTAALCSLNDSCVRLLAAIRRRILRKDYAQLEDQSLELFGGIEAIVRATSIFIQRFTAVAVLEQGTLAAQILTRLVERSELSGADLISLLNTDKTQVSRATRKLRDEGLAYSTVAGRSRIWRATPKGQFAQTECVRRMQQRLLTTPGTLGLPMRVGDDDMQPDGYAAYLIFLERDKDCDEVLDRARESLPREMDEHVH